jgi:hypothetical protein
MASNSLYMFGHDVFVLIPKVHRKKTDEQSTNGKFDGFCEITNGIKYYSGFHVYASRDVRFSVNYTRANTENPEFSNFDLENENSDRQIEIFSDSDEDEFTFELENQTQNAQQNRVIQQFESQPSPSKNINSSSSGLNNLSYRQNDSPDFTIHQMPFYCEDNYIDEWLSDARPKRIKTYKGDYKRMCIVQIKNPDISFIEPKTFKEAIASEQQAYWWEAMREEMQSLEKLNTWTLFDPPLNIKPLGNKWVYKIKYDLNWNVERFKARLVAKSFLQKYGETYFEVFAL